MKNYLDFSGKVVLVTGSTRGIGYATAKLFAEHGATTIINSRTAVDVERITEEFRNSGYFAEGITADMSSWKEALNIAEKVYDLFGRFDVVVNNAASRASGTAESLTGDDWLRILKANVIGPFFVSKAAYKIMKKQSSGSIINIASSAVVNPPPHVGLHYVASKGALFSLTRAFAKEAGEFGIRVNTVMPAFIRTGQRVAEGIEIDPYTERSLRNSFLKRLGEPEEIASVCLFLASDLASYITGEAISAGGVMGPREV